MKKYLWFPAVFVLGCSSGPSSQLTFQGSATAPPEAATRMAQGLSTTSPSALEVKIYELWASMSELCTDPVLVFRDDNPEYKDFVSEPVLGTGSLENGTYPCLMIVMSDTLNVTPEADVGTHCMMDVVMSGDICNDGTESPLLDGTTTSCTDGDDKVASYMSTAVTAASGDGGFMPPDSATDPTTGGPLASALVVDGDATLTMYIDFTDRISDNGTNCQMDPALVGFK